jgi:hypothetical protein
MAKEEQEANLATLHNFVTQREDEKVAKKAEALMKRKEDEKKGKMRYSSSKKDKNERSRSSDRNRGRQTK